MNQLKSPIFPFVIGVFCLLGAFVVSAQDCNCTVVTQNCAVPITRLNGQDYQVSGVVGGLTTEDPTYSTLPQELFTQLGIGNYNVAILVIDQFTSPNSPDYSIPQPVFSVANEGQLIGFHDDGTLTHGDLVFNHINGLLAGAFDQTGFVPNDNMIDDTIVWNNGNSQVAVRMVDALQYNTPTPTLAVASDISAAILDLTNEGFDSFVLNMSFAILPCSFAFQYGDVSDPDVLFDDYAAKVSQEKGFLYNQLISPIETLINPDPLHYLVQQCAQSITINPNTEIDEVSDITIDYPEVEAPIEAPCDPTDRNAVLVGSAGNSGLPYPLFPAAYPEVVSVSASEDGSRASYSNYNADTGLLGGWFQLVDAADINGGFGTADVYYRGTSFSGPIESVCLALEITSAPACQSILTP